MLHCCRAATHCIELVLLLLAHLGALDADKVFGAQVLGADLLQQLLERHQTLRLHSIPTQHTQSIDNSSRPQKYHARSRTHQLKRLRVKRAWVSMDTASLLLLLLPTLAAATERRAELQERRREVSAREHAHGFLLDSFSSIHSQLTQKSASCLNLLCAIFKPTKPTVYHIAHYYKPLKLSLFRI